MELQDYYKILELTPGADDKEIKNAYRRLARKFHPDISKEPNAEQQFKSVKEAYEILTDPLYRIFRHRSATRPKPYSYAWFRAQWIAKIQSIRKMQFQQNNQDPVKQSLDKQGAQDKKSTPPPSHKPPKYTHKKGILLALMGGSLFILLIVLTTSGILKQFEKWQTQQQVILAILKNDATGIKTLEEATVNMQDGILKREDVKKALANFYIAHTEDAIAKIETFEEPLQQVLFDSPSIKETLITHYLDKMDEQTNADQFQLAFQTLDKLDQKYPNTQTLTDKRTSLQKKKKQRLAALSEKYMNCLDNIQNPLLGRINCMMEAREKIEHVGIEHDLPPDPNLPLLYAQIIEQALNNKEYVQAKKWLLAWQDSFPDASQARDKLWQRLRQHQEIDKMIAKLTNKNRTEMLDTLHQLNQMEEAIKTQVLQTPTVKKSLLLYHINEALALTQLEEGALQAYLQDTHQVDLKWVKQFFAQMRQAHETPPPATAEAPVSVETSPTDLEAILQKCKHYYQANHLTTGPEGTALTCYRTVLQQDAQNTAAKAGLKAIETRYQSWAENALRNNQIEKARSYLASLEKVNPKAAILGKLKQQLAVVAAQPVAKQPTSNVKQPDKQAVTSKPTTKLPVVLTCEDCNCSDLLRQLSIGVKPLTPNQKTFFQAQCH